MTGEQKRYVFSSGEGEEVGGVSQQSSCRCPGHYDACLRQRAAWDWRGLRSFGREGFLHTVAVVVVAAVLGLRNQAVEEGRQARLE